jgi:hypothetical protein
MTDESRPDTRVRRRPTKSRVFVVAAKPLYEDGTIDDDRQVERKFTLHAIDNEHTALTHVNEMVGLGGWLAARTTQWLNTAEDGVRCDAIDVTITEVTPA